MIRQQGARPLYCAVLVSFSVGLACTALPSDRAREPSSLPPESRAVLRELRHPDGLHRVVAGRLTDSTAWVANGDPPDVSRFTIVDGALTHRFGRVGDGPGELRRIISLDVMGGDTLVLVDVALARVSQFTADGTLLRSVSLRMPPYASVVACHQHAGSQRCVVRERPDPRTIPEAGMGWDSVYVASLRRGDDSTLTLERITEALAGSPIRRVPHPGGVRIRVDEQAADLFLEARDPIEAIPSGGQRRMLWRNGAWVAAPLRSDLAASRPLSADASLDRTIATASWVEDGSVWIAEQQERDGTRAWWRVDCEGGAVARTRLPASFVALHARAQHLLGRTTDSLGEQRIVLAILDGVATDSTPACRARVHSADDAAR